MKIEELTARNTSSDLVESVRVGLQELNIQSIEFRDPFSIVTTLSCSYETLNGLNHLLVFVGRQEAVVYLQIHELYVDLQNFSELSVNITDNFLEFDEYVVNTLGGNKEKLCKLNDLSHFISNGFRFTNGNFEHVYLVYIEFLGVFKFEKHEFQEFKDFIDRHISYFLKK